MIPDHELYRIHREERAIFAKLNKALDMNNTATEGNRNVPAPGSDAALDQGCRCPVLDNAHGIGYMGVPGRWVQAQGCPLHWPADVDRPFQTEFQKG